MNPMKDVEGVEETRSWMAKFVSMGDNSIKNSQIKTLKLHSHLHNETNERCRSCGDKLMADKV